MKKQQEFKTATTTPTATAPTPTPPEAAKPPVATAVKSEGALALNKQSATFDKLKSAWTEKKIDLSKLQEKQDGKFIVLTVGEGWPPIQIARLAA